MDVQTLAKLRKYISIVKHVEGHIDLKFSAKILSDKNAMSFIEEHKKQTVPAAITRSSLNIFTRTLSIDYDVKSIVPKEFDELLTTRSYPRFEELSQKYEKVLTR